MRFGWIGRIIYIYILFWGYSIFCIGETQSDSQDMDLPIYSRSAFGPCGSSLHFGPVPRDLGIVLGACGGLGEWACEPIFQTPSVSPQPLCTVAWARAVILLVSVVVSTCLFGAGLVKALSPSYVL